MRTMSEIEARNTTAGYNVCIAEKSVGEPAPLA